MKSKLFSFLLLLTACTDDSLTDQEIQEVSRGIPFEITPGTIVTLSETQEIEFEKFAESLNGFTILETWAKIHVRNADKEETITLHANEALFFLGPPENLPEYVEGHYFHKAPIGDGDTLSIIGINWKEIDETHYSVETAEFVIQTLN